MDNDKLKRSVDLAQDIELLKTYTALIKCAPVPRCKTQEGSEVANMAEIKVFEAFSYLREQTGLLIKKLNQ